GAAQIVTSGRSWEPAMVQMNDGEIQMFYSSEALWTPTWSQQQILMVRSKNNGSTWSAPQQVAYTSGKRDGMPVPLLLQGDKGIVFPIESVGSAQSAWMNWSSIYSKWRYADGVGSTANTRRWLATTGSIWGGGPYLVQSAAGNTIMSVHDKDGRGNTDWRYNTMLVTVGNTMAKNFVNVSRPWPGLPVNEGAINNSLFMKDATHVMAVSSRTYASPSAHSAVYWKQGTIN
ncbi:MAG: exo-alpha-sialidase, partial [Mucilaginibacter sp.]